MRNLLQARLEFFTALGLFIATGALGAFLTYPLYQQYHSFQTTPPQMLAFQTPAWAGIPRVPNLQPAIFQHVVLSSITHLAQSTQVQILQETNTITNPTPLPGLSAQLVNIPLQIRLQGSFPNLQVFFDRFMTQFPQCDISSIQFTSQPDTPQSTVVMAQIQLNMLVNSQP